MGVRAYHGSPHDFDKFDLAKIGTGEGAQAYGHGLYFAEHEPVAKGYRDTLSKETYVTPDGKVFDPQSAFEHMNVRSTANKTGMDIDQTLQKAQSLLPGSEQTGPMLQRDIAKLQALKDAGGVTPHQGRMYEVNINADPEHFLDFDKPLSQQHPKIQTALPEMKPDWTGGQIHESSKLVPGDYMDKVAAAEALRQRGIPGIKYLDQGSRATGDGSRNYVVFDPALIEIMRKYGLGGLTAGAGGLAGLGGMQADGAVNSSQ
jgi:hypothetical protein